jgi:hypothetical protein
MCWGRTLFPESGALPLALLENLARWAIWWLRPASNPLRPWSLPTSLQNSNLTGALAHPSARTSPSPTSLPHAMRVRSWRIYDLNHARHSMILTFLLVLPPNSFSPPLHPFTLSLDVHSSVYRASKSFADRFLANFGWRFAIQLSIMYMVVKGILNSVVGLVQLSYCKKTLMIDGTACQTMGAIASTPWAIKGAIGVVSDAYPLFGYHKASYIMVAASLGTAAFAFLAAVPIHTAAIAAGALFLTNFEIATADLLCEGKYAELMQTKPKTGSTMVSFVWGCFQVRCFRLPDKDTRPRPQTPIPGQPRPRLPQLKLDTLHPTHFKVWGLDIHAPRNPRPSTLDPLPFTLCLKPETENHCAGWELDCCPLCGADGRRLQPPDNLLDLRATRREHHDSDRIGLLG